MTVIVATVVNAVLMMALPIGVAVALRRVTGARWGLAAG